MDKAAMAKQVIEHIKDMIKAYEEEYDEPLSLSIINRRFGVSYKAATGETVRELVLRNVDIFKCGISRTGATSVRLVPPHPLEARIKSILNECGPLDWSGLTRALKGCGYNEGELMSVTLRMNNLGMIQIKSGVHTLVEPLDVV